VFHPLLAEALVKFQSETMMSIFPAAGPVKTIIVGKETPAKKESAERVQDDMNYQLTEVMTEYRPEHEEGKLTSIRSENLATGSGMNAPHSAPTCSCSPLRTRRGRRCGCATFVYFNERRGQPQMVTETWSMPPMRFALKDDHFAVVKQDFDVKAIYMLSSHSGDVLLVLSAGDADQISEKVLAHFKEVENG
jgi:hypothetical protein